MPVNAWIQHVKKVQRQKNLSYRDAITEARKTWRPSSTGFRKGSPSKTRPGRLDFVTHKGDKDFDRGGHRKKTAQGSKVKRRPYQKKTTTRRR